MANLDAQELGSLAMGNLTVTSRQDRQPHGGTENKSTDNHSPETNSIKKKTGMRILGLNTGGLNSKLRLDVFEHYVTDSFDVVCLTETKLDALDEVNINIEGFIPIYHHRKHFVRKSGGIATLI